MPADPYRRHRFPPEIIAHAVWLCDRFTSSFRDVEELLAARGVIVSDEASRLWCAKFGPDVADQLRRVRQPVGRQSFLDEVFVRIGGVQHYPWRAVDQYGVVVDILVQPRRGRAAAERFFRHLLRSSGVVPHTITTDRLASHKAALPRALPGVRRRRGHWLNHRAENSHQPTRLERVPRRDRHRSTLANRPCTSRNRTWGLRRTHIKAGPAAR